MIISKNFCCYEWSPRIIGSQISIRYPIPIDLAPIPMTWVNSRRPVMVRACRNSIWLGLQPSSKIKIYSSVIIGPSIGEDHDKPSVFAIQFSSGSEKLCRQIDHALVNSTSCQTPILKGIDRRPGLSEGCDSLHLRCKALSGGHLIPIHLSSQNYLLQKVSVSHICSNILCERQFPEHMTTHQ